MTEMFQQKSFQKLSDTTHTVVMTDSSAGWVKGFSHTVTTEQPAQQQDSFSINSSEPVECDVTPVIVLRQAH